MDNIKLTSGAVVISEDGAFVLVRTDNGHFLISTEDGNRWSDIPLETDRVQFERYNKNTFFGYVNTSNCFNFGVDTVTIGQIHKQYPRFNSIKAVYNNLEEYYKAKNEKACCVGSVKCEATACCKDECKKEIDVESLAILLPAMIVVGNDVKVPKAAIVYKTMADFLERNKEKFLK